MELARLPNSRYPRYLYTEFYGIQLRLYIGRIAASIDIGLFRLRSTPGHVGHRNILHSEKYAESPNNPHLRIHLSGPLVAGVLHHPHLLRIQQSLWDDYILYVCDPVTVYSDVAG